MTWNPLTCGSSEITNVKSFFFWLWQKIIINRSSNIFFLQLTGSNSKLQAVPIPHFGAHCSKAHFSVNLSALTQKDSLPSRSLQEKTCLCSQSQVNFAIFTSQSETICPDIWLWDCQSRDLAVLKYPLASSKGNNKGISFFLAEKSTCINTPHEY